MMKLTFLGTKGEIEESNKKHRHNASLLIISDGDRLIIDYGMLHKYSLDELAPDAILITHAHPDHYVWLKQDVVASVPVYLTGETFEYGKYKPAKASVIEADKWYNLGSFSFLAYRVLHSIRCPAVGYKIKAQGKTLVYNSDLVAIVEREKVLADVDYYIGDGSSTRTNLVRSRGGVLFGHTRTMTQINWCRNYGIDKIFFTHLGKETIAAEDQFRRDHPEVVLAYDGLEVII